MAWPCLPTKSWKARITAARSTVSPENGRPHRSAWLSRTCRARPAIASYSPFGIPCRYSAISPGRTSLRNRVTRRLSRTVSFSPAAWRRKSDSMSASGAARFFVAFLLFARRFAIHGIARRLHAEIGVYDIVRADFGPSSATAMALCAQNCHRPRFFSGAKKNAPMMGPAPAESPLGKDPCTFAAKCRTLRTNAALSLLSGPRTESERFIG